MICVLVIGTEEETGQALIRAFSPTRYRIVQTRPGAPFVEAARRECPEIVVIDQIDERPEAAGVEVEVLKAIRPDVRIVVVSRNPSTRDAEVVERGVYYYQAGPPGAELVEVVEAASRSLAQTQS